MSVNNETTKAQAVSMFNEINRILKDNGKYICVTLAEDFILDSLLDYFILNTNISSTSDIDKDNAISDNVNILSDCKWCITIEMIENIKPSPFKAFFLLFKKL